MKNLLSLLVFSFVTLFGYAQCDEVSINLTSSNECLPLAVYNLQGEAPVGATVLWSWQANPGGAQLLYDEEDNFIVSIKMTQAGLYQLLMEVTLSDGTLCSEIYEQEIFDLEELQTNLQSSYVLCDGLLETEFSILNAEDFTSVNWVIGSEYYSDFTSTVTFEEAGTYILTILAEDIHGCNVFEEVQFEVVEGPSYENTTVSLLPSISDLSCLAIASVHQLNASVSSDYDPQSIYWITTETTTAIDYSFDIEVANAEAESLTYPLQVQFEDCVLDYTFAHAYTVQHQSSFSNSYAGTALCEDQTITLSNTSPQLNWSSNFSWAIESANILSETANAITFEYASDGDYNWALNYNGACASEAELEQTVDVDIIQPQLAEGLNQLSCLNAYTLDLSHATVLESDESYDFSWSVISSSGASMNSISESPSFELNELGAYDVSLTISNTNTSCGATVVYNDFFNLGGLQVLASETPVRACLLDLVNTSDFILSEQVSQYDYEWTISQGASTIYTINGYSNNFQITEAGIYSVSLLVSDTESDCDIELQLTDYLEVYAYPEVEISTNGIEFCEVPASLEATNNLENTPSFGTLSYDWELSSATSTLNNSSSETYSFDIQNSGNYTLSVTLTNDSTSCSLSDEIAISVEDLNLEFNFETLSPECDGYVFEPMLYATNSVGTSVNYNWEILNNSGSVVASSTLSNPSFELTEASSYSVSLTLSSAINTCENEFLFEDVVQINSLPAIELSSEDLTICELPYEINITDNSGFAGDIPENSFEWNLFNEDGLVTSSNLSQEFNYTFTENGEYVLSLTNSYILSDCSVTESINISVNDVQLEFLEEIPGSQCSGYSLIPQNFISSPDLSEVSYLWQVIDATDDVVFSSSSTNPVFMLNNPGSYSLYVQVSSQTNSCLFETTLDNYVDIKPLDASISTSYTSCTFPFEAQMQHNSVIAEDADPSFLWVFYNVDGSILTTSTEESPSYIYDTEGYYDISLTITDVMLGCMDTELLNNAVIIDSVEVVLDDSTPFVSSCAPYSFSPGSINLSDDTNGSYSYLWELIDEEGSVYQSSNSENGYFNVTQTGAYDLQLTITNSAAACSDSQLLEDFVLVDNYNIEIAVVDDNNCFNDVDTVVKTIFVEQFNSDFDFPLNFTNHLWQINSATGVSTNFNTADSVQYAFTQPGNYTVTYTAYLDNGACIYSDQQSFSIGLITDIDVSSPICLGNEFSLSQTSSIAVGAGTSYLWSSDEQLQIQDVNASTTSFSASEAGEYNLQLTVTNTLGCVETVSETIEVYEVIADFTASDSVLHCTATQVQLSSLNNDYIASYQWTVTESESVTVQEVSSPNYTHTFTDLGSSDVELIIESIHGCSDTAFQEELTLLNDYSVELTMHDELFCLNDVDNITKTFSQDIATYFDVDYEITDFEWQISPSAGLNFLENTVDSLAVNFTLPGEYTLSYSVTIDNGICVYSDALSFDIGVLTEINVPEVICAGLPFAVSEDSQISIGDETTYLWTASPEISISNPTSQTPNIAADIVGDYTVSLTVINDLGCEASATANVEVYDTEAALSVSDELLNCTPQTVQFSSLNNNYVSLYTWNVYETLASGEENVYSYSSSTPNAAHQFDNVAVSDVELIIQTQHGCVDDVLLTSALVVNDFEFIIDTLDTNLCFNGAESITKDFEVLISSTYNLPYEILSYQWMLSSEVGVEELSNTESSLSLEFENTGAYTLQYSAVLDNGACVYGNEISFVLGVDAEITVPEVICLGPEFDLSAIASINIGANSTFQWDAVEGILFENPDQLQTSVSATQAGVYDISFTVTNDVGCWSTETQELEVYEVEANFFTPDSGEQCKPAIIEFESLNNDYIIDYSWNVYQTNYLGDSSQTTSLNSSATFENLFNEVALSDIELIVQSAHGCADTLLLENYVDIISPLPYFALDPWAGCDTTYVSIIDSSNFIDSYWVDYGNSYIPDYEIQDTNIVMYTYPYGETTASYVEYYLNLHAEYKFCEASFQDTVRIYPEPIIQIGASDFKGCPPFEVSFTDSSIFAPEEYSSYFWDFGDGETSVEMNPVHVFNQTGVYNVYHSVTSPNGCFSDTVWEIAIEVFEHPVASFIPLVNPFCYGMGDVLFQNNSSHDSDSLAYVWSFGLDSSFVESPTYHYDSTNTYHINLHVEDSHGCIDDSTQWVYVEVLDTLVIEPDLQYVTVTDNGVIVVWSDTLDNYFENISVHHQSYETTWDIVYYSDSILPNEFFHDDVATFEVNDYTVVQQDSCGYFSDSSVVHSTVALTAFSPSYQTINLEWTRYYGWDLVESYDIYRSVDGASYQFLDQVPGDSLNYQDNYLCNVIYGYYVVANHPVEAFQSRSNKKLLEPLFIDYTVPIELIYTSVNENNTIMTEWQSHYLSTMTYYNIDRWDDYFGWIENYGQASESPYIDTDVGVNSRNYLYKVSYADVCGNEGPNSGLGKNILLEGVQYTSHYDLTWNAYIDWDGGVSQYIIQYYNQLIGGYQDMTTVSGTTLNYTDTELTKDGVDTSYCYRVVAVSAANSSIRSYSNSRCFTPGPRDYFPNAFSPNDDGVNEVYKYHGQFAKDLKVEIYSRWGALVYSSDQVTFEWDGRNQQNGKSCAQGTYIFRYEMKGYDGTLIKDEMVIFLLR